MISKEYDEFDLALGLYHWLQHNWQGQSDPLYKAFCELTAPGMFRVSPSHEYFESLADTPNQTTRSMAQIVYDDLTMDNYREALDRVLNYKSE